ncbi:unnamed protein product [Linum tenue]|uniref:Uncharacterized protein n=1 Tax=Linum tenue TaxID=586396 RepID=A0AAV0PVP7_9ROSI|nr:unnamed protein product [Linum tenue]
MNDQTLNTPLPGDGAAGQIDDQSSATMLDLTSFQLHDLTSVELPPTLTELDLTANRLSSLDPRIAHLANLTKLSLRQNLIDDAAVEPLSHWDLLSGIEANPPLSLHLLKSLIKLRLSLIILHLTD